MAPRLAARVAVGWLVLLVIAAGPAGAQQPGPSLAPAQDLVAADTIAGIRVEGNQRIEAATIRSYMTVEIGDPFDPAELDQSLKNLYATGLFDDVSLRREGDQLVVTVVENPIINRIAFEGNRRLDDETLSNEVQLRPRVVYTRSRVQNAVSRILELYRRNGRFAATVEPKVIELPQNRVDLVFEINEGPLTDVSRIVFIGNEAFSDSTLRDVIQTKEAAWYRFFTSDDTYDPDRLAFDQELLRRFYLARGYADFNVGSAIAELTPDGRKFVITFTVEEGERYEFGKVDLESRLPDLDPEQLRELITTESGDVYNADEIEDSIVALTEEIGKLGYAFVQIEPEPSKHADERAHRHQLRDQRGSAGLRRADRHRRQSAHPRPGDPARVPGRRGRRLQHRAAAPLAPAHPEPRLFREGRAEHPAGLELRTRPGSRSRSPSAPRASCRSAPATRPPTVRSAISG